MSDTTRNLIDYAAQDDAVNFRAELYAAIHDRVTAHIEAKKQEIAQGLVTQEEKEMKHKAMKKEEEKWHMKKEEVEELDEEQLDELSTHALNSYLHKGVSKFKQNAATMSPAEKQKKVAHLQKAHSKLKAKGGKFEEFEYGMNEEEEVESVDENAFTDYKTDKKPSIFAPKSHSAKKTEKGTMYTKNWSKKDMEHKDDDKMKKEAVDKEAEKHVRVDGETDMKTKTVDMLRGRVKVPVDYHNKSKSYKVAMPVGEEMEHDDEKEDKALVKKMVKKDALKKEQVEEAFKGPEAGSGVGDHPFVTSEAKPLKNARELAKNTMGRLKKEMLGKISN